MRGEKINVSNISKIIEEEIDHFSEKMEHIGNDFQSKKKELERLDLDPVVELEAPLRKGFHC